MMNQPSSLLMTVFAVKEFFTLSASFTINLELKEISHLLNPF